MKTEHIKNCEIKVPKSNAFAIETALHLPRLHCNMLFVAKRGSGKSVKMTNMIRMLQESGSMDRAFVISPTFNSNKALLKQLNIEDEDIYSDPDDESVIQQIIDAVDDEREDYERYHEQMKQYKKFMKLLHGSKFDIPDEMLLDFYHEGEFKPPEHRWKGRKPTLGLIIDDCQSTKIFRSRKFLNMVTRHRHLGQFKEGGALGLSLFICIQNFTASGGGCPRAVRNNVTHLVVFKTKDQKELQQIAESCSGEIDIDTFYKVHEYAMCNGGEFPSLFIDLHKKDNHPSGFRINYDTFIIPEQMKDRCLNA